MDERIQAERPMPRLSLDLDPPAPPPPTYRPPDFRLLLFRRWVQVALAVLAVLFVVFVWPTPYRYESTGTTLVRINRFTGDALVITSSGSYR
jgi:hypothetical protein